MYAEEDPDCGENAELDTRGPATWHRCLSTRSDATPEKRFGSGVKDSPPNFEKLRWEVE